MKFVGQVRNGLVSYFIMGAITSALTGCQSSSSQATPALTSAKVGIPYSFNLLTHCGVEYLLFDGKAWKTDTPLGDGMGNPPPDWPSPFALGVVTLVNASQLTFTLPGRAPVQFHVTPENVPICS